jgi:hypothetical protein
VKEIAGSAPVPESAIDCGELPALSVTTIEPVAGPAPAGVKVTLTMHVAAGARVAPHVVLLAKLATFVPAMAIDVNTSGTVEVLVSVTDWGALVVLTACTVKASEGTLKPTEGTAPLPLSAIICGEVAALSVTVIAAVAEPATPGVKATEIMHVPAAASVAPQVVVFAK